MNALKPPFSPEKLFPEERYELIRDVPLIDAHEATNTRSGKRLDIDDPFLEDLAKNGNQRFHETGDATPYVVGHTGKAVANKHDGIILGYFVNFNKHKFLNTNRNATHADLYLERSKKDIAALYPRRSIELWVSRRQIDPVSALGADSPERDLGLLLLQRTESDSETPYQYSLEVLMDDPNALDQAKNSQIMETQPYREIMSKVESFAADLLGMKQQLEQQNQVLAAIQQILDAVTNEFDEDEGNENQNDLLGPADDTQPQQQPQQQPVQMAAATPAFAGPNNSYVPTTITEPEKKKMANENEADDKIKFQKAVEEAVQAQTKEMTKAIDELKKAADDYKMKFARTEAENIVLELENKDRIDFGDAKEREWHVDLFTNLDNESRQVLIDRQVKARYSKKKPEVGQVPEAVQFSRTEPVPAQFKGPEDVQKFIAANAKSGVSYEEYLKQMAGGAK